jgi:hypothetical protein
MFVFGTGQHIALALVLLIKLVMVCARSACWQPQQILKAAEECN